MAQKKQAAKKKSDALRARVVRFVKQAAGEGFITMANQLWTGLAMEAFRFSYRGQGEALGVLSPGVAAGADLLEWDARTAVAVAEGDARCWIDLERLAERVRVTGADTVEDLYQLIEEDEDGTAGDGAPGLVVAWKDLSERARELLDASIVELEKGFAAWLEHRDAERTLLEEAKAAALAEPAARICGTVRKCINKVQDSFQGRERSLVVDLDLEAKVDAMLQLVAVMGDNVVLEPNETAAGAAPGVISTLSCSCDAVVTAETARGCRLVIKGDRVDQVYRELVAWPGLFALQVFRKQVELRDYVVNPFTAGEEFVQAAAAATGIPALPISLAE